MSDLELKELNANYLDEIAEIHMKAFPGRALSQLGLDTVKRYYKWQFEGPHDLVAIGLFLDKKLIGFCFGGVFRGALSGFLRTNRNFLVGRVIAQPWLIVTNSLIRDRVSLSWRIIKPKRHTVKNKPVSRKLKSFGILSIAVTPNMQGYGYGRMIMEKMENISKNLGFQQMNLSVDVENHKAIRFYEQLGWVKATTDDGTWKGRMIKSLGK